MTSAVWGQSAQLHIRGLMRHTHSLAVRVHVLETRCTFVEMESLVILV